MLMCCVCAFSLHRESPDMILGAEPLISEVVLSHGPLVSLMVFLGFRTQTLLPWWALG
jgi:hypothetical protein